MAKKNLHPEWHKTKIFCDGKLVLEVGTTKKELYPFLLISRYPRWALVIITGLILLLLAKSEVFEIIKKIFSFV